MVWDPTKPATGAALLSQPVRDNWAALDTLLMTPVPALATGSLLTKGASAITGIAAVAVGQVLISQGVATAPVWSQDPAIRNLLVNGGTVGTSGVGVLALGPGTAPTTSPVDTIQVTTVDYDAEAGSRALYLRDERGGQLLVGTISTNEAILRLTRPAADVKVELWCASFGGGLGTLTNQPLYFWTNNTTRLMLDTAGNLGLGATTFGSGAVRVLALLAGAQPTTYPADTVQLWVQDFEAQAGSGALLVRDEQGGLLAFGTVPTGPTTYLRVHSADTLVYGELAVLRTPSGVYAGARTAHPFYLMTGGTTRVTLDTAGNLFLGPGSVGAGATQNLVLYAGSTTGTIGADCVRLVARDLEGEAGSGALHIGDERGNWIALGTSSIGLTQVRAYGGNCTLTMEAYYNTAGIIGTRTGHPLQLIVNGTIVAQFTYAGHGYIRVNGEASAKLLIPDAPDSAGAGYRWLKIAN